MARRRPRLHALGLGLVVACVLLVTGGQLGPSGCYASHAAYRAQVDALLSGELALSDAPEAVVHDYAWSEGGVHQVWGLGVPAWQLPFELAGRAVGAPIFPDRIPLLAWLALMFYVAIRAWWGRAEAGDEPWGMGTGTILIVTMLPAFVTLLRGRIGVYEEVAIYAYAAAVMLLGGLHRLRAAPARWRVIALLACAGLVGFIRPTTWCYGLATAIVASAMWLQARGRRGLVEVAIGGALFVCGGAALYGTNAARFGDGLEFGHHLNIQGLPGNLYATRFSYPMQRASVPEASLELFASLFDRPETRARSGFYQKHLHHGVTDKPRWREYYFTTFSWPYLPVLVAGFVLGILAWRRGAAGATAPPRDPDARWLLVWATLALVPMFAFYVRAPFMSSRYQLDFAPAFAALIVIAWRAGAQWLARRPRGLWIGCGVLAVLLFASVALARTAAKRPAETVDRATAAQAMAKLRDAEKHPRTLPGVYDLADPWLPIYTDLEPSFDRCAPAAIASEQHCLHGVRPLDSEQWTVTEDVGGKQVVHRPPPALYLNLFRWDLETGQMPPATFAFVDDPQFIELEVSTLDGKPADWAHEVRAAVGLVHMRLAGTTPSARGTTLRFEAPELPRGLVVAFFAFGPDDKLAEPSSRFAVHRIRWR